jgi:hypothetical protein
MTATWSGQIDIAAAGTAVQGTDTDLIGNYAIKGHVDNTGAVFVGKVAADVDSTNGYPLDPGQDIVVHLSSLSELWFDAETSGNNVCWLYLGNT